MTHRLTPLVPIVTLVSALVLLPIHPAEAQLTGRVPGALSGGFSGKWSTPRAFSTMHAGLAVPATSVTPPVSHGGPEVAWRIDFSDYAEGSVEEWLQAKGFRLEQGAEDPELLALSIHEGALVLEAKGPVKGFLVNQDVQLKKVSKIRIHWGIIKYPKHASYERQVNNEALMLYVFFGQNKVPSGHFALPALPYFIGLFLGQEEPLHTPYKGRYFHEGGRFVCVGNLHPHETVMSEFDLSAAFQTYFDKDDVPMISGITLGIDTFSSGDKGKAAAYIYSIEFLECWSEVTKVRFVVVRAGGSRGQYPCNRVDYAPLLRATLVRLDQWVTAQEAPPPTYHPRLPDGMAVTSAQTAARFTAAPACHSRHRCPAWPASVLASILMQALR